jgi:biopolymer transport protein ExbB
MYTTALGLSVAIPAMVTYSFLISRQNELLEQLTEKCSKLTEVLTSSHIPGMAKATVFPEASTMRPNKAVPPGSGSKAS